MAELKIAATIKLSQNEWVMFSLVLNGWIHDGRFQDSCHHQVESEWITEVFLCKCWELVLASVEWVWEKMAESKMAEFKMAEYKMAAIIKYKWEWMSLSQNELVWVRVRLERESVFEWTSEKKTLCLNPRCRIQDGCHLSSWVRIQWVKVFLCQWWVTNLGKCEWVWKEKQRWLNPR